MPSLGFFGAWSRFITTSTLARFVVTGLTQRSVRIAFAKVPFARARVSVSFVGGPGTTGAGGTGGGGTLFAMVIDAIAVVV